MELEGLQQVEKEETKPGRRILIIEDNSYVREAFELTLRNSDLDAHVVTTAEEGMEAVRNHTFDVIISDYRLPGMSGLDFFILSDSLTSCSTKVLISAYGFEDIGSDAKAVGVDHLFIKPFSIQKLISRLNLDDRSDAQPNQSIG